MTHTTQLTNKTYQWQGIDRSGQTIQGEIQAVDRITVKAHLHKQGIKPQKIRQKRCPLWDKKRNKKWHKEWYKKTPRIDAQTITRFTRQLATLVATDLPLLQSFTISLASTQHTGLRLLIQQLKDEITTGTTLTTALAKYPHIFDPWFCGLVAAGEQSGTLATMLHQLADDREKNDAIKQKIKQALRYPLAVLLIASMITGVFLIKIVPTFAQTFASLQVELPALTRWVLTISNTLQQHGLISLLATLCTISGILFAYKRYRLCARWMDNITLKLPLVATLMQNTISARLASTLAITITAGIPLANALAAVTQTIRHHTYVHAMHTIQQQLSHGQSLHSAMRNTGLFPLLLTEMIAIGEQSGTLPLMLDKAAAHFTQQVDTTTAKLTLWLEPLLMSLLGVLIGGLMLAMYLPIFQLSAVM